MSTYKLITLVGTSPKSYDEATAKAVADAAKSVRDLCWFEVKEMRGRIVDGKVDEYQVKVDVGFRVDAS